MVQLSFLIAITAAASHQAVVDSKSFTSSCTIPSAFSHTTVPRRISRRHVGHDRNPLNVQYNGHKDITDRSSVICNSAVIEPVIAASTSLVGRILGHGVTTFMSNWKAYSIIPLVAGFVGWFTNYLAVQMIFYPIKWRGIPIVKVEGEPLGLLGWQGIVPARTLKMSEAMVNATINQLLTMEEIIQRLDPDTVADILLPSSGQIVQPFVDELLADQPKPVQNFASNYAADSDGWLQKKVGHKFLRDLTVDVQENVGKVCNLRNCVVDMMMSDRSLLGKLFQISGKDELAFLTDSGLWFGFLLGLIQLVVALYWDNPWTLSVGGLIVGLATNWLALKWIFEPVNPKKIGPFVLQGLFLRRQNEVAADFSKFFATRVLTSRQLWSSILTDPTTLPEFESLLANRFASTTKDATLGVVDLKVKSKKLKAAAAKTCANLFEYLVDLHEYVDKALEIEQTLRARMMAMTSTQFERVLHPIFEEDELTLILAGGGLGFLAGLVQQLISTGSLVLPRIHIGGPAKMFSSIGSIVGLYALFIAVKPGKSLYQFIERLIERTRQLKKRTRRTVRYFRGERKQSPS